MLDGDAVWLLRMQVEHLDLGLPSRISKIEKRLETGGAVLLRDEYGIVGHLDMRKLAGAIEIHSVVIDKRSRGKGLSHRLVHQAWERWRQDPILHGRPLVEKVNLAAAVRGNEHVVEAISKPMIAFTRNPAMGAALSAAGFKIEKKQRCWWKLWIGRSRLTSLSMKTRIHLCMHRIGVGIRMGFIGEHLPKTANQVGLIRRFLQRRRRLLHQLSYLDDYELFILSADMKSRKWPRRGAPSELRVDPLATMRATHFAIDDGDSIDIETVDAWDDGQKTEDTPFLDMVEEE